MGKTVRRRHNKDGSVTTTISYSRKNIFGTRRVTSHRYRSPVGGGELSDKFVISCIMITIIIIMSGAYFLVGNTVGYDIAFYIKIADIALFISLLLYDIPPLRALCLIILKCLYKLVCLIFRGIKAVIKKITSQKNITENKTELTDADFNDENKQMSDSDLIKLLDDLDDDDIIKRAIICVSEVKDSGVMVSYIQRKMHLGYARSARIIDELEQLGVVGAFEDSKPRKVLVNVDVVKKYVDRDLFIEKNEKTYKTEEEKDLINV